jgi:hypothetical protein
MEKQNVKAICPISMSNMADGSPGSCCPELTRDVHRSTRVATLGSRPTRKKGDKAIH